MQCGNCTHQAVCLPFRQIEAVLLEESCFQQGMVKRIELYTALAGICDEYDPADYLRKEHEHEEI